MASRVNGPACWNKDIAVRWNFDENRRITQRLRNGVLSHAFDASTAAGDPDVEIGISEADLRAVLLGEIARAELPQHARITGDSTQLTELFEALDTPDPDFPIVPPDRSNERGCPVSRALRWPRAVRPGPPGCTRRVRLRRGGRPRTIRRTLV
ncbi:alkyl sulfatase C-terminal domain-containing protein [Streptomyces sp. NPDC020800]|uniref:alkyl sulfatase C-terminal domain-containing protein n=1 Tax=Streptomyces sp. NPDC020800 TaxID=3365092 RepID=UPI00379DB765